MDLEKLYRQVDEMLSKLDFDRIWPGFKPLRFALYDEEKCFFGGRYVEKTDDFCANTSIIYQGEQIAIWKAAEETDLSVLTSKMVHEMFHGFQRQQGWDCWPNETEALYRYTYDAENLALKLRENELLLAMLDRFDNASFRELLSHRKRRREKFPYEFSYESKVEEIEGSANFVEWQALRQLDEKKAAALTDRMRVVLTKAESLFPIRISGYFSGALMISALLQAGCYSFDPAVRPAAALILDKADPSDGGFPGKEACLRKVSDALRTFFAETDAIIQAALQRNEIVLRGPLELVSANIYDARCCRGYITSTYFLMARDGTEDKLLYGNFVIRMKDEKTIETVYRWE
ncbi:MAG: hypothetical protein IJM83_00025 [Firmicutes bacterium]|nr:hypothetical protein [Lachnospiraceae bacterium]MBQ7057676.1 hypothetical protein [Bacillota bacterium]